MCQNQILENLSNRWVLRSQGNCPRYVTRSKVSREQMYKNFQENPVTKSSGEVGSAGWIRQSLLQQKTSDGRIQSV